MYSTQQGEFRWDSLLHMQKIKRPIVSHADEEKFQKQFGLTLPIWTVLWAVKCPFFFLHLSREAKLKYVYYINLYLVMDYFIQLLYGYGLFSTDPAKRVSILGLSAYFFQLLLFFIPSVVILLLSPCFHYWWRRGLLRLWNHNMFLAIVAFYTLCNYSPAIPIAFSNWGLALFSLSAEGTNNLLTGFIRNMLEVEAQHE